MTRRLAEVAKYAGVSEATVSRVLNGKPGISDATRTAVLTALDVLGYERPTKLRGERALPPPARARPARGAGQRRDRRPGLPAGVGRRRPRGGPGVQPSQLAR